jgi:hypothetical protein
VVQLLHQLPFRADRAERGQKCPQQLLRRIDGRLIGAYIALKRLWRRQALNAPSLNLALDERWRMRWSRWHERRQP